MGKSPPVAVRPMLVRQRLLDRLRVRWFVPVTSVSAPAGYGKTTLLAQAVAANAGAPAGIDCWLTCSPDASVVSSLGEGLCRTLDVPSPDPDRGIRDLVAAVVDAIWRRSPQQVALILDDVHEIPPESDAAALLGMVVAALPANGHVVLAGRAEVPLRLARLEIEGRVAVIDQAELAFTPAELVEFASLRHVDGDRVTGCGGWPALAELAASSRENVAGQYVDQEVLADWPASRRRALALLAHLQWFDEEVAHAVVESEIDLDGLAGSVPLVAVTAGDTGPSWSVHSLWRSWLATEVTAAEVADARRQAGKALLEQGQISAAMGLLLESEAWDEVSRCIVEALSAAHPPVARDVLADWYTRLPSDVQAAPSGRLLATVLDGFNGDDERTWRSLEECAAAFRAAGDTDGELASLVQLGLLAWWTEEPERLAGLAARVFELEAEGCEPAVPLACLGRALLWDISGDSSQVVVELDRIPPGTLSDVWQGIVSWVRSMALLQLGLPQEALAAADDATAHVGSIYPPLAGSRLQAVWCLGRASEVLDALPAMYREIKKSGSRRHAALAAAQCSVGYSHMGQPAVAAEYLEHARGAATVAPEAPLVDSALSIAEAVTAVVARDEASAAARLSAYIARHPVGQGLSAGFQRRHLALLYVLVPETRPIWDATDLGPVWTRVRLLAQALVAARERRALPPATTLDEVSLVQTHLPPPWVAELALAAISAGRNDGWHLLDATWTRTRPLVAAMARSDRRGPLRTTARAALAHLPVPPSTRLSLRLLGGAIELTADGNPVQSTYWRRERVRQLLAYFALHPTVSRAQVAEHLWPTLDHAAQSRNLRVTLTYLLRVLEPERSSRDPSYFVRQHGGNLTLHAGDWLTVDVWDFDAHYQQASQAGRRGAPPQLILDQARAALALWPDEPSELAAEEWAVGMFEHRRLHFAALATRAGELLLARDDVDSARHLAQRALGIDPWREAAHRLVVASHQAAGEDLAARRALQRYQEVLNELGLDPDEKTLMVERLLDSLPATPASDDQPPV